MDGSSGNDMKTFINYYGGKYRIAPIYPLPKHDVIIEPFAGGAGYSLRHHKKKVMLFEVNQDLVDMWQWLITARKEDVMSLPTDFEHLDDVNAPNGAKVLIGFCLNTGVVSPCKTKSRWAKEWSSTAQFWGNKRKKRIAEQVEGIKHWECYKISDYSEIINMEATWFVDPPYQKQGVHYPFGSDGIDFEALSKWCLSRDGEIIVCEQEGATWLPWTHSKSVKSNSKTKRSSEVWFYSAAATI